MTRPCKWLAQHFGYAQNANAHASGPVHQNVAITCLFVLNGWIPEDQGPVPNSTFYVYLWTSNGCPFLLFRANVLQYLASAC